MKVVVAGGFGAWARELPGAAVVNLAGELVDRRPTRANVELLTRSRVEPTRALARAAADLDAPVPVWLQAGTLAVHGDAGEAEVAESSPSADGPAQMAGVARWGLGLPAGAELEGTEPPRGVLVASSPTPVRNAELMAALRRVLRRPPAPPTPALAVRAGSVLLRTDPALGLTGRRAVPAALLAAGFPFAFPRLEPALSDLLT
ncbi:DUF1731 domain-containing protein [Kineococcus indalonis]|uniref:DUF1731 domain-containing protein n=1 Tax=Kineococcus indalonis TaxID=2696566 RepID=UPI001411EC5B|nr:DUF1731 domain-containing protein [Kineococcus indalonis]NAZ87094.1 DUF1731 domain-containing protein [Kineococcus indalonis]